MVWRLPTDISGWGRFFDVRVLSAEPEGGAVPGQRMRGESGPRWLRLPVSFTYTLVDGEGHRLELDGRLPTSITVREVIDCIPLESARCRVNYHCNFELPPSWQGRLTRVLFSRGFREGPVDSLRRLKRAAEAEHRGGAAGADRSP